MPPRVPLRECNLFFFDSETGGLNAYQFDMVEVACLVTDPTGQTLIGEYTAKVFPKKTVDPVAAKINGYTTEKWAAEAVELDVAMIQMLGMARNCVFAAHNAPFDWSFFEVALAKRYQRWPGDYHKIDTVALAMPLLQAGKVQNLKLTSLAAYFGVAHQNVHSALGDVRATRGVYVKLMELYAPLFTIAPDMPMAGDVP